MNSLGRGVSGAKYVKENFSVSFLACNFIKIKSSLKRSCSVFSRNFPRTSILKDTTRRYSDTFESPFPVFFPPSQ